ncbi:MAG: hypothetical protein H7Z13_03345 [Ferruginibacter sp.]|nr:hypothetical protein [Ferruginibacter sp.]
MRTTQLMITAAIMMTGFMACNNTAKDAANQDAALLSQYVDSIEKLPPVYTLENWTAIDNGYQERALTAEKTIATLEEADQAKAEESKRKYAALKANYQTKLQEKEAAAKIVVTTAPDYRQVLRNRLFGEGKIGADMKFGFVNGKNILGVYRNFVNAVADNKDNYTREDWDEIKVLYEALDTRKNAVEKDLASSDNIKIAGQKVRFASIKATNRGGAKINENEESKN